GVVAAVYFGQLVEPFQFVWFAFLGGLAAAALVSGVASAGPAGSSPVKLALAGVIVSSLLQSWLTGLLLLDQQTLDVVRFWMAGSLAGRRDRKSTRLNSSHVKISYAVFCWKKKRQGEL